MTDFDKITFRKNTNSYKWNVLENELPMWVADMDFEVAPEIKKALLDRVNHGIFGYNDIPEEFFKSAINWWDRRHNFKMEKDWLLFSTGVVPTISSCVRRLTHVAENVLVQAPCYNIFYNSIVNNGRNVVSNDLIYNGVDYEIDWIDLENKLKNPQTTLMILCNPANPVGKIWDRDNLEKIGKLAYDNNVVILSDEIHCDITKPGKNYIPFASVNEINKMNSVTAFAATKCFNMAGIQTSYISIPNPVLRHNVWRQINTDEIAEINSFGACATIAAFNESEYWLDELREYIYENVRIANEFIKDNIKGIKVVPSEATYLIWLDCSKYTNDSVEFAKYIREYTGLFLSDGAEYGGNGNQFLRMNLATQRKNVLDGLARLKKAIDNLN